MIVGGRAWIGGADIGTKIGSVIAGDEADTAGESVIGALAAPGCP